MRKRSAVVIFFEIILGLIVLLLIAAAVLAFRLSSGPLELSILKDDIEQALTRARDDRPVEMDKVFLEWSPEERRVRIASEGLVLKDGTGNVAARADNAEIVLSATSLLSGQVDVLQLDMSSGWIDLRQVDGAQWTLAGETLPPITEGELPRTPKEWIDRSNEVLPEILKNAKSIKQDVSLERVAFKDFELKIFDSAGNTLAAMVNSGAELSRTDDGSQLLFSGGGLGEGLPKGFATRVLTFESEDRGLLELSFADWSLSQFADRLGVTSFDLQDLPAKLDLAIEGSEANGLSRASLTFDAEAGAIKLPRRTVAVRDADGTITYTAESEALNVDITTSGIGAAKGQLNVTIPNILNESGPFAFEAKSNSFAYDMTPTFSDPFEWNRLDAAGSFDLATRELIIKNGVANLENGTVSVTANLKPLQNPVPKQPPFIGSVSLQLDGQLSTDELLKFWPVNLGSGARRYIDQKITGAVVSEADGKLMLAPDSFVDGYLADDALALNFRVQDAAVSFLHDMPPVTEASGTGQLRGNSIDIKIDSAKFDQWAIGSGVVEFPAFNPKGQDFRIFAKGTGAPDTLLTVLKNSRLDIDIDPKRFSGEGEVEFELFRPALENVPFERTKFTAKGKLTEAKMSKAAFDMDLDKGSASINVTQDGMTISGYGDLGPLPIQFTWRDAFRDGGRPADLSATSVVTPDTLNNFGLPGRAYFNGEAPVEVQAKVSGDGLQSADLAFDFADARVDVSEIGFVKPKGEAARASVRITEGASVRNGTFNFASEKARLNMAMQLEQDGNRLIKADVIEAKLEDTANVTGSVSRRSQDDLLITLEGQFLDLNGFVPDFGALGGGTADAPPPINLEANVDLLRVRPGLDLGKAKVSLKSTKAGLETFSATGETMGGSNLDIAYQGKDSSLPELTVKSDDAAFLASAFLGIDFLEGGALTMSGDLGRQNGTSKFDISITDAQLSEAPFLTQILSLASLRGLADTLSGEGVTFSRVDIPLTVAGDRFVVDGARAEGHALGLTGKGFYQTNTGEMEFDGVLVPSFNLNSALGRVPIIGDLVVGRDGEGIFSLTYGVRRQANSDEANISVNPLSALAPGVIRRIFENPSDTSIPEARPRDLASEPLPSELPPLPDEEF